MSGSDIDYYGAYNGPTDTDIEDAAEREQDALAQTEAILARDAAFSEWVRRLRVPPYSLDWSQIFFRLVRAREASEHHFYVQPNDLPLTQLAAAEHWPYVLRLVADVMEREPFETGGADPRR